MANINYLSTLNHYSFLPPGTICRVRGNGSNPHKFDYVKDDTIPIPGLLVKEELVRAKTDGTVLYRKVGEVAKTVAELRKDRQPVNRNPRV